MPVVCNWVILFVACSTIRKSCCSTEIRIILVEVTKRRYVIFYFCGPPRTVLPDRMQRKSLVIDKTNSLDCDEVKLRKGASKLALLKSWFCFSLSPIMKTTKKMSSTKTCFPLESLVMKGPYYYLLNWSE